MNWFTTEHTISDHSTLAEAASLKQRLRAIEGLRVVDKGDGKLWLLIGEPKSLKNAPPGSHEFARGFLIFSTMLAVRHELLNAGVWWEEAQVVSTDGPHLALTGECVQVTHKGHTIKKIEEVA